VELNRLTPERERRVELRKSAEYSLAQEYDAKQTAGPGDGAGVSLRRGGSVGKHAEDAQSTTLVPRETVRGTDHEWPNWLREALRGPLSKPRGKRTWSISESPVKKLLAIPGVRINAAEKRAGPRPSLAKKLDGLLIGSCGGGSGPHRGQQDQRSTEPGS